MMSVWEHIHRLYVGDFVISVKQCKIPRLCGRIAADINKNFRERPEDGFDNVFMHPRAGRVYDHNVRTAMMDYELVGQQIFHVPCVKKSVADSVGFRIDACVGHSGLDIFDAYNF